MRDNIKKTIGFVSASNPFVDRKAWSGTIFMLRSALEKAGFKVKWIPYESNSLLIKSYRLFLKFKQLIVRKRLFRSIRNPTMVKCYAESIDLSLVNQCDFLFFPGGAQISLFLHAEKPIIYLADATVHQMIGYYWKGFEKHSIEKAKQLEERAVINSSIIIRPSQWALNSTINDCGADPNRCFVLEFGPNIDLKDIKPITPYSGGELRLLFSGVEWDRKGGNIAVEIVKHLREKDIDAVLFVVGPKEIPAEYKGCDFVKHLGFLDKNKPEEYAKYLMVFEECHALLLPTRAECSAIVLSEATAFGMPCYTTATGGVLNYVVNGYNGYAFPENAIASDIAEKIVCDIRTHAFGSYYDNALRLSNELLSWEVWSERFAQLMSGYC